VVALLVFALTQTTRIMSDWWIRWGGVGGGGCGCFESGGAAAGGGGLCQAQRRAARDATTHGWSGTRPGACTLQTQTLLPPRRAPPPRSWAADHPAHFYADLGRARGTQLYLAVYGGLVAGFIGMLVTRDTVFNAWAVR
jgi:hypothetical protein